jgi:hypothetical protein
LKRRGFLHGLLLTFVVACKNRIDGTSAVPPHAACPSHSGQDVTGMVMTRGGECVSTGSAPIAQPTPFATPPGPAPL